MRIDKKFPFSKWFELNEVEFLSCLEVKNS